MILDEILHFEQIFWPFWHGFGQKRAFCVQNFQKVPGDNVAQRVAENVATLCKI